MYVSKFFTFTASVICQLAAGLAYCFSLYSDALKVPDCETHDPKLQSVLKPLQGSLCCHVVSLVH